MPESLVLPSYYFAPASWFVALLQGASPLIHQGLIYRKQQFFSRMHIRHAQGVLPLSIPIRRRGEPKPLAEKYISYQENWPQHHWRSLRYAYQNAPYFVYYETELMALYALRPDRLTTWHEACLGWVCETLQLALPGHTLADDSLSQAQQWHQGFDPSLRTLPIWCKEQPYTQVFEGYRPGLSILDLLFNLGPESIAWLRGAWEADKWPLFNS